MKKSELLNWLQEEYQQWEAFLDQIDPTRMEQPGVKGDWLAAQTYCSLTGRAARRTRTAPTLASAPAN